MVVLKISDMKICGGASKHRVKHKTHRVFSGTEGESTKNHEQMKSTTERSPWLPTVVIGTTGTRVKGVSSRRHRRSLSNGGAGGGGGVERESKSHFPLSSFDRLILIVSSP
jgi:hypothetical protein